MEQMALSALVDACKSDLLKSSRAALQSQSLTDEQRQAVMEGSDGSQNAGNLLRDSVLEAKGINPAKLDDAVAEKLIGAGVEARSAAPFAKGQFEELLRSFRKDGSLGTPPFYVPRYYPNPRLLPVTSLQRSRLLSQSRGFRRWLSFYRRH